MYGKLKNLFSRLFYEHYWVIGIARSELFSNISGNITIPDEQVTWLNSTKGFFLADPYWLDESKRIIICEYLNYKDKIGRLAVVYLKEDWSIKEIRLLNSNSAHYSYPHVIRASQKCYVVPESALDNYLKLLEIDVETHRVTREHVLIEKCQLVDPTIFYYESKYWMFANPLDDFNNTLHIYYADNIEGPWKEANNSPLHIRNCRGAGSVYYQEGFLMWPAQSNDNGYGGGVIIRKIIQIDPDNFIYESKGEIRPNENSKYSLGLHTLNIGRSLALIDGKSYSFQFVKPFRALYFRIKRLLFCRN